MNIADLQYGFSFSELKQKMVVLNQFTVLTQSLGELAKKY
jgi:hypothetical protein